MSASVKSLLSTLTSRGPHRVLRGNLAIAGQPGVVYTPDSGRNLPAVAFGHGWMSGSDHYRSLLEHLASWGFVAAAPDTERGPIPSHVGLATDLRSTNSNAVPLAAAWGGPMLLRTIDKASADGLAEGRHLMTLLGAGKHEHKTARTTRALLTGYLLATVQGDKTFSAFADPETSIPHTHLIDPHTDEVPVDKPSPAKMGQLVALLRK